MVKAQYIMGNGIVQYDIILDNLVGVGWLSEKDENILHKYEMWVPTSNQSSKKKAILLMPESMKSLLYLKALQFSNPNRVATFRFRINSLCFPCIFPVFMTNFPVFFST